LLAPLTLSTTVEVAPASVLATWLIVSLTFAPSDCILLSGYCHPCAVRPNRPCQSYQAYSILRETAAHWIEANCTADLAFIDADKDSYPAYLDWCLRLVRPGGLIVADNVLRRGEAVDTMNRSAASGPRLEELILPVRDGADGILVGVVRAERHS
jgi:hypothetical protein